MFCSRRVEHMSEFDLKSIVEKAQWSSAIEKTHRSNMVETFSSVEFGRNVLPRSNLVET